MTETTPRLGYCTACLDLLWKGRRDFGASYNIQIVDDPKYPDGGYFATGPAAAVDAHERGARVFAEGLALRMRADVVAPEPRCVEHYRVNELTYAQRALRPWNGRPR